MFSFEDDYHALKEWERRGIHVISINAVGQSKTESLTRALASLQFEVDSLSPRERCDLLIVEDDEAQRIGAKILLESKLPGLWVECAADGLEASMLIGKLRPRLIWVDIRMPRMNGLEFIEFVRRINELNDTKIIIVSAFRDPEYTERAEKLNVDAFIGKPSPFKVILAKVAELLGLEYPQTKEPDTS